jgi:hypothetical protein
MLAGAARSKYYGSGPLFRVRNMSMKTIVIKTQAELDALPEKFDEYTIIEIRSAPETWIQVRKAWGSSSVVARDSSSVEAWDSSRVEAWDSSSVVARGSSRVVARGSSSVVARGSSSVVARGSSRVVAWDSSRVVAWDSSRVEAWDSSRVEAYQFATIVILSSMVSLGHVADRVVCRLRGVDIKPKRIDKTAKLLKEPASLNISFETWLERGYVVADGIHSKLISRRKKGDLEIFKVQKEFLGDEESYVVKRGNQFSHGDTIKHAVEDLRYKLADRDTSRFKKWTLKTKVKEEDAIQAYRAITGACEFGVKQFVSGVKVPKALTVEKVVELTSGRFGNEAFAKFFAGSK